MSTNIIRGIGINFEIGFVMFDPLCSLGEIEENLNFLIKNDLTGVASSLSSELRLQIDSRYLKILQQEEKELKIQLYERDFDPDTLCHSYIYSNPDTKKVITVVRNWNSRIRPIHYPLKNLSRYGQGGILKELSHPIKELLKNMRSSYAHRILEATKIIEQNGLLTNQLDNNFNSDLKKISQGVIEIFSNAPSSITEKSIVSSLISTAQKEISNVGD